MKLVGQTSEEARQAQTSGRVDDFGSDTSPLSHSEKRNERHFRRVRTIEFSHAVANDVGSVTRPVKELKGFTRILDHFES